MERNKIIARGTPAVEALKQPQQRHFMNSVIPSSEDRVSHATDAEVNESIATATELAVLKFRGASPAALTARIEELKREWDVERTLELNAGLLTVAASFLVLKHRRPGWAFLSLAVGSFLALHAVRGWCPPLPVLRRAGVRTPAEIHEEILALRILRGDFVTTHDPAEALQQARGTGLQS